MLQVEAIVTEKLYAGSRGRPAENFALLDKIRIFHASFIALAHVLPRLQRNPWGDGPKIDTVL